MASHPLFPNVRRSPYFAATERAGATVYMPYNHMYMPMAYGGRAPDADYRALTERVTLWDVGAERQVELAGAHAYRLADRLLTRDLSALVPGMCRYALACDADGVVLADVVVTAVDADRVWLSHGNVDLLHWVRGIALDAGLDVRVSEPDVAPLQVQGPRAREVLRPLVGAIVDELAWYRAGHATLLGHPVVVARTGWSAELGFEVYPLGSERALEIWDAIVAAGEPHGLLVTGPVVARAVECGIRDTTWATGMGANALEVDQRLVELDAGPFVGREALRALRADGGAPRTTVGLVGDGAPLPRLEGPWPVFHEGVEVGATRWAVRSPRLARNLAIGLVARAHAAPGTTLELHRPDGVAEAVTVAPLPFLGPSPGART
jgi:aminomethyltransferase